MGVVGGPEVPAFEVAGDFRKDGACVGGAVPVESEVDVAGRAQTGFDASVAAVDRVASVLMEPPLLWQKTIGFIRIGLFQFSVDYLNAKRRVI